jgi:CheY-like chemotaxis protein
MAQRGSRITILMAEDDPDDRFLTQEAFREAHLVNDLHFVDDGEDLMDYLYQRGKYTNLEKYPRPGLILLDLNMPRKDGRQALEEIKADPDLHMIPVVVLTTSQAEEDILASYDLGVSGYITKPVKFQDLIDVIRVLGRYWFEVVELPAEFTGG